MEEVGKYQSIQDRIKRLTKNQASSVTPAVQRIQILSPGEDSQKQNINRMNFAKKRQNSENNLRTLTTTRQYTINNQRTFDLITNMLSDASQASTRQGRKEFKKTSNHYAIRKPTRDSLEDCDTYWDSTNYSTKRNDSVGDTMERSVQHIMMEKYSSKKIPTESDEIDFQREKSFLIEGNKQNKAIRRTQFIKKAHQPINPTTSRPQYSDMSNRRSMDDETISKMIKCQSPAPQQYGFQRKIMNEISPVQICNRQPETMEIRSRMITRCKSGTIQRVPGRIIKNK